MEQDKIDFDSFMSMLQRGTIDFENLRTIYPRLDVYDEFKQFKQCNMKIEQPSKPWLLLSVISKDWEIFEFLLNNGYQFHKPTRESQWMLLSVVASNSGSLDHFKLLMNYLSKSENEININQEDSSQSTALHFSVRKNLEFVKLAVELGGIVDASDVYDKTPLFYALELEQFEIAEYLLSVGANINHTADFISINGSTYTMGWKKFSYLHYFTDHPNIQICKWLVKFGIDLEILGKEGNTALHLACRIGDVELFEFLIKSGSNIASLSRNRENCLHLAIHSNSFEIASLLIDKGIDINALDKFGQTPLMKLAYLKSQGVGRVFDLLLKNGANPNIEDYIGNNALHHAALNGSDDFIRILIGLKMNVNAKNKLGQTVLSAAIESKNFWSPSTLMLLAQSGAKLSIPHKPLSARVLKVFVESKCNLKEIGCYGIDWENAINDPQIVSVFIESGFDVNEPNEAGFTPLIYASAYGSVEIIEILMESGAKFDFRDNFGHTAFHFAANYGKLENLKYLISKYTKTLDFDSIAIASIQPLFAISGNYFEESAGRDGSRNSEQFQVLRWLVEEKNVSLETNGNTFLELACKVGDWWIVEYLIRKNQNLILNSPLVDLASESESHLILDWLIEKGFSLKSPAKPVLIASKFGKLDILQRLKDEAVDWNCVDDDGNNGLHHASKEGYSEIFEFLKSKINVNSRNYLNQTPLMLASKFGHFEIVLRLSEIPSIDLKDKVHLSAFDYACLRGDLDCVKLLHSKKAKIDYVNAFKCATKGGNSQILDFLISIGLVMDSDTLKKCIAMAEKSNRSEVIKILRNLESTIPISVDATGLLAIDKSEVEMIEEIGNGGFGKVYKGTWKGQAVAIKQLILKEFSDRAMKDLKKEANLLFQLRGPHVVGLFGVIVQQPLCLVMEFLEKGSLFDHLSSKEKIDWNQRNQFVFEIAQGLNHLHSNEVIHRDLKSPNILMDKNCNLKLADFGLASLKEETAFKTQTKTGVVGTFNWLAPELFEMKAKNTKASDIYAFGMICFEIISRRIPWQDIQQHQIGVAVLQGKREIELIAKETPELMKEIMESCWNQNPDKRPIISEILKRFAPNEKGLTTQKANNINNNNNANNNNVNANNNNNVMNQHLLAISGKYGIAPRSENGKKEEVEIHASHELNDTSSWRDPGIPLNSNK